MGRKKGRARAAVPSASHEAEDNLTEHLGRSWFSLDEEAGTSMEGAAEPHVGPQELMRGLPDDLVRQWILPRVTAGSYSNMARVSKGWRALIKSGDLFRLRKEQGLIGEMLVVTHDGHGWELFDPRTDSWTFLAWNLEALKDVVKFRCVAVGSKLYYLGGQRAGALRRDVLVFDLETASWSRAAKMNNARSDFACDTDGKRIYVAGGSSHYSRDAEVYNPDEDTWTFLPNLEDRHFGLLGNRQLQGLWIRGVFLVEPGHVIFLPGDNSWTPLGNPDVEAQTPYMVANVGGELYGVRHAPGDDNRHVRIDWYDLDTASSNGSVSKSFIRKRKARSPPTLNSSRYKFGMAGLNGRLYVFGGKVKAGLPGKRRRRKEVGTVDVYNPMPTTHHPEWRHASSMTEAKGAITTWTTAVA